MTREYTEAESRLVYNIARLDTVRTRLQQAKDLILQSEAELQTLQTNAGTLITDIEAELSANPTDNAWLVAKAKKDHLVNDFNAMKTRATAMKNAVAGL